MVVENDNSNGISCKHSNEEISTGGTDYLTFVSTICGKLKTLKRTGWVRQGVPLPESDADHMHRCAMCAMLLFDNQSSSVQDSEDRFHPSNVDRVKLLKMALTHDVCEALAGDITPHCPSHLLASKFDKEEAAMKSICEMLGGGNLGKELYDLWHEYEQQTSPEAIYCKDIDKFEMVVQAHEYERMHLLPKKEAEEEISKAPVNVDGSSSTPQHVKSVCLEPLRGFFTSTNSVMKTPLFRRLDGELRQKREIMLKERGWDVTSAERQQPPPQT